MRIGIMGGTLDPVHSGHLQIAQAAMQALQLDRVMLLPAGDPPHKQHPTLKTDRLRMAQLAAKEVPGMFACNIEIFRSGTTYTVDTLTELTRNNPNTRWFYIIGADTLDVLDTWRNFPAVARLCTFAVVGRGEDDASPAKMQGFREQYGAEFVSLPFNGPEISSTDIRDRVAMGEDISRLVPATVGKYIRDHGLYLSAKSKPEILAVLKASLKPGRFTHTLGVAETARRLAARYGIDPAKADLAGLLHDCAKYLPIEAMRKMVQENVPDADEAELLTESVLHAPAGMVHAQREFGVHHPEILSAIRKHTLGDAEMTPLDMLIYTADFIEPNRKPFPGLEEARTLAETDLAAATRLCAKLTNDYLAEQGKLPHPKTISMLQAGISDKEGGKI